MAMAMVMVINNDDDHYGFLSIEVILGPALRERGLPTEDDSTGNTNGGYEKVASGEGRLHRPLQISSQRRSDKSKGEHACYRPSWNRTPIFNIV